MNRRNLVKSLGAVAAVTVLPSVPLEALTIKRSGRHSIYCIHEFLLPDLIEIESFIALPGDKSLYYDYLD